MMFEKCINVTQQWAMLCNSDLSCHSLLTVVSQLHREKCTKNFLVVFQQLLAAFSDFSQLTEPQGLSWVELRLQISEWRFRLD